MKSDVPAQLPSTNWLVSASTVKIRWIACFGIVYATFLSVIFSKSCIYHLTEAMRIFRFDYRLFFVICTFYCNSQNWAQHNIFLKFILPDKVDTYSMIYVHMWSLRHIHEYNLYLLSMSYFLPHSVWSRRDEG